MAAKLTVDELSFLDAMRKRGDVAFADFLERHPVSLHAAKLRALYVREIRIPCVREVLDEARSVAEREALAERIKASALERRCYGESGIFPELEGD